MCPCQQHHSGIRCSLGEQEYGQRPTCHWVNLWVGSERVLHAPFKRYPAKSVHNAIAQHLELQAITAGEASDSQLARQAAFG